MTLGPTVCGKTIRIVMPSDFKVEDRNLLVKKINEKEFEFPNEP